MVNMVKADISGEPLKNLRQFVERATLNRRLRVVPIFPALPINVLKLVLNVEQPYSSRTRHRENRELDDEKGHDAKNPRHHHRIAQ